MALVELSFALIEDTVTLAGHRPVDERAPPSQPGDVFGFWLELRDRSDQCLYRHPVDVPPRATGADGVRRAEFLAQAPVLPGARSVHLLHRKLGGSGSPPETLFHIEAEALWRPLPALK